jgi:hypothetical protein
MEDFFQFFEVIFEEKQKLVGGKCTFLPTFRQRVINSTAETILFYLLSASEFH